MTVITLDLPQELAQRLQQLDQTILVERLEQIFASQPEPEPEMKLVPPVPLPKPTFDISYEEWREQLLKFSVWDDETINDIEKARRYINQTK